MGVVRGGGAWVKEGESVTAVPLSETHKGYETGYAVALMIPALLMVFAFGFFAIGKKHYPVENVKNLPPKTVAQKKSERATLARIGGVFLMIAVFWFVYD